SGDVRAWFWAPRDGLEEAERRDHVPYQLWARQGLLEATPGRAIDKKWIVHRLGEIVQNYDVQALAFDRWKMDEVQRYMADEGVKLTMQPWGKGFRDMSPAIDALETAILQGTLRHPSHPVLDWCLSNAVTMTDPAGNRKLVKDKSRGRIDGAVALSMAVGVAARAPWPSAWP
ncbi:terminase TerL endonuclease subunit, partial [Paracoccus salipaludis]